MSTSMLNEDTIAAPGTPLRSVTGKKLDYVTDSDSDYHIRRKLNDTIHFLNEAVVDHVRPYDPHMIMRLVVRYGSACWDKTEGGQQAAQRQLAMIRGALGIVDEANRGV